MPHTEKNPDFNYIENADLNAIDWQQVLGCSKKLTGNTGWRKKLQALSCKALQHYLYTMVIGSSVLDG